MALVVGRKQIQSITPQYDMAGALTAILVRVNRSIVDDATTPPTVRYGLPTSREVDVYPLLTLTQQTGARSFMNRLAALIDAVPAFDE